jgi:hypothetical protein
MAFHGFTDPDLKGFDCSDLFPAALCAAEAGELLDLLSKRLGGRIQSARRVQGRDTRTGRDYFFDNLEIRRRSDPGAPCFIGVYHYRLPEARKGSHLEAWRTAHDDEPSWTRPLPAIVEEARVAFAEGRLPQWMDALAEELKREIGL